MTRVGDLPKRDEIFEAMCSVCGIDWEGGITTDQRGRVNAAVKQLRDLYGEAETAVPGMIFERAEAWAVVYPDISLTPQGLTGMWSSILNSAEQMKARSMREDAKRRVANAPSTTIGCICGGDHFVIVGTRDGHDIVGPCPECGPDNASYYVQGKLIRVIDKGEVKEMLGR